MATLVSIPVYRVNGNGTFSNPAFRAMAFPGAGIMAQPVGTPDNVVNGALIYSSIRSNATGDTVFYSNLTVAQIVTAANTPDA